MKKTIPTTISGILFYIEEDGYNKLSSYLDSIKSHFSTNPDGAEIIKDIESRISEQLSEKSGKEKIVTIEVVSEIISSIGDVKDFNDKETLENEDVSTSAPAGQRKLFRNPDDVVVAGVCSGIAAYFGVETVLVRIALVLFVFAGGSGFLIYIILWLIMPLAKTSTDKLQMRGRTITLEAVNQVVKEKVEEVKKNKSFFRKLVGLPFLIIGTILKVVLPIFRKLIGFFVSLGSSVALFGLTFVLVLIMFNIESPHVDFPLMQMGHNAEVITLLFSAFFAIFIPILFVLFLGLKILGKDKVSTNATTLSLVGLWCVSIIIGGVMGTKIVPEYKNFVETSPIYARVTKDFELQDFTKVNVEDSMNITVTESPDYKVSAVGRSKYIEDLSLTVVDGVLNIKRNESIKLCVICSYGNQNINVELPDLDAITAENGTNLDVKLATTTDLSVSLSNSSRSTISGSISNLNVDLRNSSYAEILGNGNTASFTLQNSSRLRAENFYANEVTTKTRNSSRADVRGSKTIDLDAENSSYILYYGNGKVTENSTDSSRIRKENSTTTEDSFDYYYYNY